MITSEKRDEYLEFLAMTDEDFAKAKANMVGLEHAKHTVLATELLQSDLKTQGLKEADARVSKAFWKWRNDYKESVYDYEILRSKRIHAALIVDLWRSEFSARKQGVVM